jgi:DNA processing protein
MSMRKEEIYNIYKLLKLKGIGPVLLNKILSNYPFSNRDHTYEFDKLHDFLNERQIGEYNKDDIKLRNQISHLEDDNTGFICVSDPQYPKILSHSLKYSTPPILSYRGNLQLLQKPSVGFCGSRKASEIGLAVAKDCVKQLVSKDIVVVSGYACGVDQEVHLTALESGGFTIIVLPEGLLNFNVRKVLRNSWDWDRTLVISEFLPDAVWLASRAMQRNKTIIGLSMVMVLIEAGENGGSMDAAKKSLEMKRNLYVPFYNNGSNFALGNKKLLEIGGIQLSKQLAKQILPN